MPTDDFSNKAEAFEAFDDIPLSPQNDDTIGAVIARRYSRRDMLKGSLGVAAATALFGTAALTAASGPAKAAPAGFAFRELASGVDENHHVAEGYDADIVIRWGDPLAEGLGAFDPRTLTAADQAKRFGYNNDYVAFFPLDERGTRALLCVNHEYTSPEVMFAGVRGRPDRNDFAHITQAHAEIEMAAHGVSVVEIALADGKWRPVTGGPLNRRITAMTEMTVDGPAAGHDRLRTQADPTGRRVLGTLNNCAGGQTPWGTYLTAEENFHGYFWTDRKSEDGKQRLTKGVGGSQQRSYERYGIPANWYSWGKFHDRFNVDKEGNEPNRFGWIVEIDPFDAMSTPVKHTALGRFRHEGAEMVVNQDGRVVAYSGDDAQFDYVYRFVSRERIRTGDKAHNMRLLSEGTLSVARYNDDGTVTWLPLVYGEGPLTPANGFSSQADVVIDARLAADLLKATRMDRPEDVQPHPSSGKVFVLLTNNARRRPEQVDKANPRPENHFGHIIEMIAPDGDHTATTFRWEILVKCGDPRIAEVGAMWHPQTSADGWFASPDNCAIDAQGRLWIATDQGTAWPRTQHANGLYALETEGEARGLSKLFYRVPVGAELCGPCFARDGNTVFLAVQHPATDGVKDWKPFARESTFEEPATRWPDFAPNMPPRPAVVSIRKKGGGKIAGAD